jgi:hypothetical protein
MKLDSGGSITCTGNINMRTDKYYPDIRLVSANGNNLAIATAAGSFSSSSAVNDMVIRSLNRLILQSGGGSAAILITTNNRIGIGTSTNINNILQVGDGARLKISNGSDDYTIVDSKDVDDSANTCIYINGNTRSGGNAGKIQYYATTATGNHTFYTNGSSLLANTLADLAPDKIRLYKNISSVYVNYENDGILYPHSTLTNSGGSSLNGFFIPVDNYTNSLMVCAFSHYSTSYTYWRGQGNARDQRTALPWHYLIQGLNPGQVDKARSFPAVPILRRATPRRRVSWLHTWPLGFRDSCRCPCDSSIRVTARAEFSGGWPSATGPLRPYCGLPTCSRSYACMPSCSLLGFQCQPIPKPSTNLHLRFRLLHPKGKKIIFNNYKTDIKYGQQVFKLSDPELNKMIDNYISMKKLKEGNYLLSLETNKNEPISQPNCSKKIEQVFYKVYKEPISVRFLRMCWISALMKTNPTRNETIGESNT